MRATPILEGAKSPVFLTDMEQRSARKILRLGALTADHAECRIRHGEQARDVEPKVMDLLFLLGSEPGRVFSRIEILAALWPNVVVGEDTLARYIFKLRRTLNDDRAAPRYIETIPKRGYRLLAHSIDEDTVARRKRRAEEFYFQFTEADNENALALYEQILAELPNDADALAGLANGLIQRAVRWQPVEGLAPRANLREALECGALSSRASGEILARAGQLATRATQIAPENTTALRALGLVMAATGRFADARRSYERALAIDPNAWGVLVNLADINGLEGQEAEAIQALERAFAVMEERYDTEIAQIRPWFAELGLMIANRYRAMKDIGKAEQWYRRVLLYAPANSAALTGMADAIAFQSSNSATTGT